MNTIKRTFPVAIALLVGLCLFTAATTYKQQVIAQTTVAQAHAHPQAAVMQVAEYAVNVPQQSAPQQSVPDAPPPPAKAIIVEAPSVVKIGTLVEIDASQSHANSFAWLVSPSAEGNIRIVDDGRRAYLTCGKPTTYTVTIAAASSDGMASIEQVTITFEPLPIDPIPAPELPKSPLTLAVIAGVEKVQSPFRDSEQLRLANVFNTVATMIDAGVIKTPEDVIAATAKLKKEAIGESAEAWAPFSDAVGSELNKMSEAKKLSTVEDHKAVWREIANALGFNTPC